MPTILHLSDLHFGPHYHPAAGEAVLRMAHDCAPDVIVVSGDFTQRAKRSQFAAAAEFLAKLPPKPRIVVPGNHDVPLYRVVERLFRPYAGYRRHIAKTLDQMHRLPGMMIVSLNTTSPLLRIVEGRLTRRQIAFAERSFAESQADALRIVVAHHPFFPPVDGGKGPTLQGAPQALAAFAEMGVDLVLGGHLHRAYVGDSREICAARLDARPVWIVQSGTSTSRRGRAGERGRQSLNLIRVDDRNIVVQPHLFDGGSGVFGPIREQVLPRSPRAPAPTAPASTATSEAGR